MPQTKHKRKSKHRGNAAGIVEARGRTGRPPTAEEKNPQLRQTNQAKSARKANRFEKPPTWKGAVLKSLAAAVVMVILSLFLIKKAGQSAVLFPIVFALYVPISYYTDLWSYRRRQRAKSKGASSAAR
ncbi:MAG: hypothetical protein ACYCUM_06980 [Solirubrobacteraceae bacterium]